MITGFLTFVSAFLFYWFLTDLLVLLTRIVIDRVGRKRREARWARFRFLWEQRKTRQLRTLIQIPHLSGD